MGQHRGPKSLVLSIICLVIYMQAQEAHSKISGNSFFVPPKCTIAIVNNLSNASETLSVGCELKRWNMKLTPRHVLQVNDTYAFRLRPSFLLSTLYTCEFVFGDGKAVRVDDVYDAGRDSIDKGRCRRYCLWRVRDDALHGYKESGENDIIFYWPK